jgi:hypothetical protein
MQEWNPDPVATFTVVRQKTLVLDFYIFIFLRYISDWRSYGVPTIRSDLAAPRIRRISDRTVSKSGCPRMGLENPGKSLNWKKKFQD